MYKHKDGIQLLPTLDQAIPQAPDFDTALTVALNQICEVTDWDYGEAWIPDKDGTILELSPAWGQDTSLNSTSALALEQFRQCSEGLSLYPSEGLPGRVWSSLQPEWISDASATSENYFLRNQIAKAFGVKAGFGVPILLNYQVQLVLVFFMVEARKPDKRLIESTIAAVMQLENVLSRFLT